MILKANPKPANPTAKKRLAFVGVLLALCLAFGVGWVVSWSTAPWNRCLTAEEVYQHAETLDGTRVCVRGEIYAMIRTTLLLCEPMTCGCNSSDGVHFLVSDAETWDWGKPRIELVQLYCEGNECAIVCGPFCSVEDVVYEFTGNLFREERDSPPSFHLEEIDFATARQFQDGEWVPVPLESCTINFSQEP